MASNPFTGPGGGGSSGGTADASALFGGGNPGPKPPHHGSTGSITPGRTGTPGGLGHNPFAPATGPAGTSGMMSSTSNPDFFTAFGAANSSVHPHPHSNPVTRSGSINFHPHPHTHTHSGPGSASGSSQGIAGGPARFAGPGSGVGAGAPGAVPFRTLTPASQLFGSASSIDRSTGTRTPQLPIASPFASPAWGSRAPSFSLQGNNPPALGTGTGAGDSSIKSNTTSAAAGAGDDFFNSMIAAPSPAMSAAKPPSGLTPPGMLARNPFAAPAPMSPAAVVAVTPPMARPGSTSVGFASPFAAKVAGPFSPTSSVNNPFSAANPLASPVANPLALAANRRRSGSSFFESVSAETAVGGPPLPQTPEAQKSPDVPMCAPSPDKLVHEEKPKSPVPSPIVTTSTASPSSAPPAGMPKSPSSLFANSGAGSASYPPLNELFGAPAAASTSTPPTPGFANLPPLPMSKPATPAAFERVQHVPQPQPEAVATADGWGDDAAWSPPADAQQQQSERIPSPPAASPPPPAAAVTSVPTAPPPFAPAPVPFWGEASEPSQPSDNVTIDGQQLAQDTQPPQRAASPPANSVSPAPAPAAASFAPAAVPFWGAASGSAADAFEHAPASAPPPPRSASPAAKSLTSPPAPVVSFASAPIPMFGESGAVAEFDGFSQLKTPATKSPSPGPAPPQQQHAVSPSPAPASTFAPAPVPFWGASAGPASDFDAIGQPPPVQKPASPAPPQHSASPPAEPWSPPSAPAASFAPAPAPFWDAATAQPSAFDSMPAPAQAPAKPASPAPGPRAASPPVDVSSNPPPFWSAGPATSAFDPPVAANAPVATSPPARAASPPSPVHLSTDPPAAFWSGPAAAASAFDAIAPPAPAVPVNRAPSASPHRQKSASPAVVAHPPPSNLWGAGASSGGAAAFDMVGFADVQAQGQQQQQQQAISPRPAHAAPSTNAPPPFWEAQPQAVGAANVADAFSVPAISKPVSPPVKSPDQQPQSTTNFWDSAPPAQQQPMSPVDRVPSTAGQQVPGFDSAHGAEPVAFAQQLQPQQQPWNDAPVFGQGPQQPAPFWEPVPPAQVVSPSTNAAYPAAPQALPYRSPTHAQTAPVATQGFTSPQALPYASPTHAPPAANQGFGSPQAQLAPQAQRIPSPVKQSSSFFSAPPPPVFSTPAVRSPQSQAVPVRSPQAQVQAVPPVKQSSGSDFFSQPPPPLPTQSPKYGANSYGSPQQQQQQQQQQPPVAKFWGPPSAGTSTADFGFPAGQPITAQQQAAHSYAPTSLGSHVAAHPQSPPAATAAAAAHPTSPTSPVGPPIVAATGPVPFAGPAGAVAPYAPPSPYVGASPSTFLPPVPGAAHEQQQQGEDRRGSFYGEQQQGQGRSPSFNAHQQQGVQPPSSAPVSGEYFAPPPPAGAGMFVDSSTLPLPMPHVEAQEQQGYTGGSPGFAPVQQGEQLVNGSVHPAPINGRQGSQSPIKSPIKSPHHPATLPQHQPYTQQPPPVLDSPYGAPSTSAPVPPQSQWGQQQQPRVPPYGMPGAQQGHAAMELPPQSPPQAVARGASASPLKQAPQEEQVWGQPQAYVQGEFAQHDHAGYQQPQQQGYGEHGRYWGNGAVQDQRVPPQTQHEHGYGHEHQLVQPPAHEQHQQVHAFDQGVEHGYEQAPPQPQQQQPQQSVNGTHSQYEQQNQQHPGVPYGFPPAPEGYVYQPFASEQQHQQPQQHQEAYRHEQHLQQVHGHGMDNAMHPPQNAPEVERQPSPAKPSPKAPPGQMPRPPPSGFYAPPPTAAQAHAYGIPQSVAQQQQQQQQQPQNVQSPVKSPQHVPSPTRVPSFPVSTLPPSSSSPHSRPAPVAATSPKPVPQYAPTQFQQPPQQQPIVSPKPVGASAPVSPTAPVPTKPAAYMPPPPPLAGPTFVQDTVPVKSPFAKPAVATAGVLSVDVPSRPSSATSIRSISTAGSVTPTTHATAFDVHEEGAPEPLALPDAHNFPLPSSPRGASASTSPGSATSASGLVRPAPLRTNAPLPVKCTTCGTFGPAGGRFCAWCGSPLTDAAPPPKVSYPTTPPPVAIPTMRGPFQVHLVGSKVPLVAFSPRGFMVVSFPRSTLRYSNDPAITKPAIKLFAGPIRFEPVAVRDEDGLDKLDEGALLEPGSSVDRSRAIALRWLDKSSHEVASDVDALASGETREHALDKHLLMRVLHALVASIGSGVPSDFVMADVVREHLVKFGVLVDEETPAAASEGEDVDKEEETKSEEKEKEKETKDPIMLPLYNLLLNANKLPDAVELCLRNSNWSMAMALAGRCVPDVWARANGMFAKYGLVGKPMDVAAEEEKQGNPWQMPAVDVAVTRPCVPALQFALTVLTAQGDASWSSSAVDYLLLPSDATPTPPTSAQLNWWREALALILTHRNGGNTVGALVELGNRLKSYGRMEAAALCHLVAQPVGTMYHGASVFGPRERAGVSQILLGASHTLHPTSYQNNVHALLLTEIVEFFMAAQAMDSGPLGLNSPAAANAPYIPVEAGAMPHLVGFKLAYARRMLAVGQLAHARSYVRSAMLVATWVLKRGELFHFSPDVLRELHELGELVETMAAHRVGSLPQPTAEMAQIWSGQQFAFGLEFGEFKQTLLATDLGRTLEPILGSAQTAPIAFPVDPMQQQQQQQQPYSSPYKAPLADYGRRLSTLSNSGLLPAPSSANMPQAYGFTSATAPALSFDAARQQQPLSSAPVSKQASFIGSPQASATVVSQVPPPAQQQSMYSQQHLPLMSSPSQHAVHSQQQAPPMHAPMPTVSSPQSQAATAPPPAQYGQMPPAPMYGSNSVQQLQQPSSFDVTRSPQQFAAAPGMSPGFDPAPSKQRGLSPAPAPINTMASPVNQPAAAAAASPPASAAAVDEWDDLGFGNSALKKDKGKTKADGQGDASGSAMSPKDTDSAPKSASDSGSPADGSGGSSSGIFGIVKSVFGRKKKDGTPGPVKANLGEESTFYFDKELGRWVNKNDPSSASMTTSKPPPPPPARTGSAPPGGGAPPAGGSAPPPSMGSMSMNTPPPAAASAAGGLPPAHVGGNVGFGAPGRAASPAASIHSISSVASMPPLGTFGLPTPINRGGSVPGSVPESPSSPGPAGTPPIASSSSSTPAGSSAGRTRQRPSSSMGFNPIESLGSGGPPPGPASSSLRNMRGRSRYVDVLNPGSGTSSPAPPSGTSTPAPPAAGPSFLPSAGGGQ